MTQATPTDLLVLFPLNVVSATEASWGLLVRFEFKNPVGTRVRASVIFDYDTQNPEWMHWHNWAQWLHDGEVRGLVEIEKIWKQVGGGEMETGAELIETALRPHYDRLRGKWEKLKALTQPAPESEFDANYRRFSS